MPDHRPLFSSPGAVTAPSTTTMSRPAHSAREVDLGLEATAEGRRQANPGDELTVDPADRRRRARAALLDLRRDVIRRSAGY